MVKLDYSWGDYTNEIQCDLCYDSLEVEIDLETGKVIGFDEFKAAHDHSKAWIKERDKERNRLDNLAKNTKNTSLTFDGKVMDITNKVLERKINSDIENIIATPTAFFSLIGRKERSKK